MENEETVDPAVQQELDCLNTASEQINQLENELSNKRKLYRQALSESSQSLEFLSNRFGECVNKARPYHEAVIKSKDAQHEIQTATINFERAVSCHDAAKEMVLVAEQGMLNDRADNVNRMDTAWPEMLNHATIKVNNAEADRFKSELEHERCAELFKKAQREVYKLERKLKTAISKSRPYFEAKKMVQKRLEELSISVAVTETQLSEMKKKYSSALKNLEEISESIHRRRGTFVEELGAREEGVGAESSPQTSPNLKRSSNFISDGSKTVKDVELVTDFSETEFGGNKSPVYNKGIHAGSSETIGSLRSNGSGSSEASVTELSCTIAQLDLSSKPLTESLNNLVLHKPRTEVILSVAALQSYSPSP